jgi:nitrogen fixation protein FixH
MKISIPVLIIITFVAFAMMIGYFVVVAMRSEVNLVSQDYYQKELLHEDYMKTIARTDALGDKIKIILNRKQKSIDVSLLFGDKPMITKGKALFYRPSSSKLDFEQEFITDDKGFCAIPLTRLVNGNWKMGLEFEIDGKKYLKETTFNY